MKRTVLAAALALALTLGAASPAWAAEGDLFPTVETMPVFSDVTADGKGSAWYDYESVKICVEAGLMKGAGGAFDPSGAITVAEAATVAARIWEKSAGAALREREPGEIWYGPAVTLLQELGVTLPDDLTAPASRGEFVSLLADVLIGDASTAPINHIETLPDTADADVLRFYNAGIVSGTDKYGSFSGDKGLTRAEAAAMVARIVRPGLRKTFAPETPSNDPVMGLLGVTGDTAIATVNGAAVSAKEYLYHLTRVTASMGESLFGSAADIDWGMEVSGASIGETFKDAALERCVVYRVAEEEAAKAGATLSAEDLAEVESRIAAWKNVGGGTSAAGPALKYAYAFLDEESYRHILSVSMLVDHLKAQLFGNMDQAELDVREEDVAGDWASVSMTDFMNAKVAEAKVETNGLYDLVDAMAVYDHAVTG